MKWRIVQVYAVAALLIAIRSGAAAQASPRTFALPARERLVYARSVGPKNDEVETRSRLVSEKGASWYEVTSRSADQDMVFRLDPSTLFASYIEVISRGKDATLRRVTTVLENKTLADADEIIVSSFESLPYSLRVFPWGERQRARISFLGSAGGGNFRFDLAVVGKATLAVGDRGIECWKAQLSLGGVFGAFVGKSYLWYSVEAPHFLVKSEGSSGGPGSPTSVLTLQSYSAGPE